MVPSPDSPVPVQAVHTEDLQLAGAVVLIAAME